MIEEYEELVRTLVIQSVVAGVTLGRGQERALCRAKLDERLDLVLSSQTLGLADVRGALSDENLGPVEGKR